MKPRVHLIGTRWCVTYRSTDDGRKHICLCASWANALMRANYIARRQHRDDS